MKSNKFLYIKSNLISFLPKKSELNWMYILAFSPILTDLVEIGRYPSNVREWFTEISLGVIITLLVCIFRKKHFRVLALTLEDPLTGLMNRRAFDEVIQTECSRKMRIEHSLSLIYIDLDNFKLINDRYGHDTGDNVLRQFSLAIRRSIRTRVDHCFRLGGDEFAIILPGSNVEQADILLSRLVHECDELSGLWKNGPLGISSGITEYHFQETPNQFVQRADRLMYRNKEHKKMK